MGRQFNFTKVIFARIQALELAEQMDLQSKIAAGPPLGSGISADAWRSWNEYGWLVCPRTKWTCSDPQCGIGPCCKAEGAGNR
jgi:hypothetical protein